MVDFNTIDIAADGDIITCILNRPHIRNAFNEEMIRELKEFYTALSEEKKYRLVVLRGVGKSFCAGADLEWMRSVVNYSYEQNYAESLQLSECLYAIYSCKIPTAAIVHGAAIGGANGLLAACDIVYAEENTVFSLSEVKIGIIPACISPYILKRVGEFPTRELMISGRRFRGPEAEKLGLINKSLSAAGMEDALDDLMKMIRSSGPNAVLMCKELIDSVTNQLPLKDALAYTAKMIAEIRRSEEGQEGMAAFLEKRKPGWVKDGAENA